jgi:hypothetical protein
MSSQHAIPDRLLPLPIVTIASKNYMAHARALAKSYLNFHPDGQVFLCLADHIDGYFDPNIEPFTVILAEDLGIPNWQHFSFKYDITELNTALKPYILDYLFKTYNLDRLAYFDPDIIVFSPLDELNGLLTNNGVVLTPHILEPEGGNIITGEQNYLLKGMYNLGFIGLSQRTNLDVMLKWWKARLYEYCVIDIEHGLFVDQRWIDFAPAVFTNVHIWRNPACNVATWNILKRPIELRDGRYWILGNPLVFFHFSHVIGYLVAPEGQPLKSKNLSFTLANLPAATQTVMVDYLNCLQQNGYSEVKYWPYAYGMFENGERVLDGMRYLLRKLDPTGKRWPNPFKIGNTSFFSYIYWRFRLSRIVRKLIPLKQYERLRRLLISRNT